MSNAWPLRGHGQSWLRKNMQVSVAPLLCCFCLSSVIWDSVAAGYIISGRVKNGLSAQGKSRGGRQTSLTLFQELLWWRFLEEMTKHVHASNLKGHSGHFYTLLSLTASHLYKTGNYYCCNCCLLCGTVRLRWAEQNLFFQVSNGWSNVFFSFPTAMLQGT